MRAMHGYPGRPYGNRLATFSEAVEKRLALLRQPKWGLLVGGMAVTVLGVRYYSGQLAEAEHRRAAYLTNSERSVLGSAAGSLLALLPDGQVEGLVERLGPGLEASPEGLSTLQRMALHALTLRSQACAWHPSIPFSLFALTAGQ